MDSEFEEVSEKDYKELEDKFKYMLESSGSFTLEHPELREDLDNFIIEVGKSTKDLLQKYGKNDYIQKLEVEDYKDQMMVMKRKNVKMNLSIKQVSNAINAFNNISNNNVPIK